MIQLTDEEIRQELAKLPETNLYLPSAYQESSIEWNEFIAKAQLKKVAEHIGRVLVKYSVIDGKLSKYIEGTTPLWALPNLDWQAILEEIK